MTSMSLSHHSIQVLILYATFSMTAHLLLNHKAFQNIYFKDESIEKYLKIEQFSRFSTEMLHCAGTDC